MRKLNITNEVITVDGKTYEYSGDVGRYGDVKTDLTLNGKAADAYYGQDGEQIIEVEFFNYEEQEAIDRYVICNRYSMRGSHTAMTAEEVISYWEEYADELAALDAEEEDDD